MKKFTKHLLILKNSDQVIIGNKYECTFLKLSAECFGILEELLQKGIDKDGYGKVFCDPEDEKYFINIYDKLTADKILVDEDDEERLNEFNIQWEVTNKCNLHCRHCLADAVTTNCINDDKEKIFAIADKILEIRPQLITLTGGEPMVLPFFFELSEYIRSKHKNELDLMTNGTFINAGNAERITKLFDAVFISVDGIDEASCSEIRGAGVFGKVMDAIGFLKAAGQKNISLSYVLTSENMKYEKDFYKLCSELEVKPMVRAFSPVGRGEEHKDWYVPENTDMTDDKAPPEIAEKNRNGQPYVEFGSCGGRYASYNIGPDGSMYWCAPYESEGKAIDNILEISDTEAYFYGEKFRQSAVYKEFEEKMPENYKRCSDCCVKYFCWHCPFLFEQAIKNNEQFNNYCRSQKKDLMFSLWGVE
jgi:radical SAM protein with 4Fe4S-binding SPASM domain